MHLKDKKGKTKLEKRTCKHCKLYHSTIEAKHTHQRKCKAEINQDVEKEETDSEEEGNKGKGREGKLFFDVKDVRIEGGL